MADAPLWTSLWCMLCSGGIGDEHWTKEFTVVFMKDNHVHTGTLFYSGSGKRFEVSSNSVASDASIVLKITRIFSLTPTHVFLIHSACYRFLQNYGGQNLNPVQVFKLCQALQPDKETYEQFRWLDLADCLDPIAPVVAPGSLDQRQLSQVPIPDLENLPLLQLPLEILLTILGMLPPSSLIPFFCSSKQALSYAKPFCRQHPLHFYHCMDFNDTIGDRWPTLMLALYSTFMPRRYSGLDRRWEVISTVTCRAKYIAAVPGDCTTIPTVNPTSLFESVDHPFGFQEILAEVPSNLRIIEVYSVWLGKQSNCCQKLYISSFGVDIIRFIVEPCGLRSLIFGDSQWSHGDPEGLGYWEGFSKKQVDSRIRIVQDGLKFRHITWCQQDPPSFAETILMRKKHASFHGQISKEQFVHASPNFNVELEYLLRNWTAEAFWLPADTRGITIYGDYPAYDLLGIQIHPSPQTYAGAAFARFFPLHGPEEVIAEVEIHRSTSTLSNPLVIILKTNWNRQCSIGLPNQDSTAQTLRPPKGSHIDGFYFQFRLRAFGVIHATGSRGSINESCLPTPKAPAIPQALELNRLHFFASCARLFRVRKIWIYHDVNYCIGLRLFYNSRSSEALGRACGDQFQEFALLRGDTIRRIWVIFTARKQKIKHIEFDTDPQESPRETAEPFKTTESTVMTWWFNINQDVIHFSDQTLE